MRDGGERGGAVERELTEKPPRICPAAIGARSEQPIEQGKVLRACQRQYVVAWGERRSGRNAAREPVPNHYQNARTGRDRESRQRFRDSRRARFHSIAH